MSDVQGVVLGVAVGTAHAVRRFQVESTGEDRQAHEQCLFRNRSAGDRTSRSSRSGSAAGQRVSRATAEQPQPVQPTRYVKAAHRRAFARRPVRSPAEVRRVAGRSQRLRPPVRGRGRNRACPPLPGRRTTSWRPRPAAAATGGDPLALHTERFSARCQHDDVRAVPNDLVDQPRGRGQDVLAVVHHQQHRARPQKLDHGGLDAEALLLLQPQCRSDGVTDSRTVIERSELAERCAVVELFFQPTGDLEGQSGLSDAADAGQRHQRTARQGRWRRPRCRPHGLRSW